MSWYDVFLRSAAALLLMKFLQKLLQAAMKSPQLEQRFEGMQNLCWAEREDSLHYVAERVQQHGPATVQADDDCSLVFCLLH